MKKFVKIFLILGIISLNGIFVSAKNTNNYKSTLENIIKEKERAAGEKYKKMVDFQFDIYFKNSDMNENDFGKQININKDGAIITPNRTDVNNCLVPFIKLMSKMNLYIKELEKNKELYKKVVKNENPVEYFEEKIKKPILCYASSDFLSPGCNKDGKLMVYGTQFYSLERSVYLLFKELIEDLDKTEITEDSFNEGKEYLINLIKEELKKRQKNYKGLNKNHETYGQYINTNRYLNSNMDEIKNSKFKDVKNAEKNFVCSSKLREIREYEDNGKGG